MKGGDKERLGDATIDHGDQGRDRQPCRRRASGTGDAEVLAVLEEDAEAAPRFDPAVRGRRAPGIWDDKEKAEVVVIDEYMPAGCPTPISTP